MVKPRPCLIQMLVLIAAILLADAVASALFAAPAFAAEKIDAWVLKQKHIDMGNFTVYAAKEGVKVEFAKTGCTMLTTGPAWSVYYYRTDEKSVWLGTRDRVSMGFIANPYQRPEPIHRPPVMIFKPGKVPPGIDQKPVQPVEILGEGKYESLKYNEYSAILGDKKQKTFRTTGDIAVDPRGSEVICRLYGIPLVGGVPLYVRENQFNNQPFFSEHEKSRQLPYFPQHIIPRDVRIGPQVIIQTISAIKTKVDPAIFQAPVGYAVKRDILDITFSKAAKSDVSDMIESVGYIDKDDKKAPAGEARSKAGTTGSQTERTVKNGGGSGK